MSFFQTRSRYVTGGGDLLLVNKKTYAVDWDRPIVEGPGGQVFPGVNVDNPAQQVIVKVFFNPDAYYVEARILNTLGGSLEGGWGDHECAPYTVCFIGKDVVKVKKIPPLMRRNPDLVSAIEREDKNKMYFIMYARPDGTLLDLMQQYDVEDRTPCMKYELFTSLILFLTGLAMHRTFHRSVSPASVLYYQRGNSYRFVVGDFTVACTDSPYYISSCNSGSNIRIDDNKMTTYRPTGWSDFSPPEFRRRRAEGMPIYLDGVGDMMWQDVYGVGLTLLFFFTNSINPDDIDSVRSYFTDLYCRGNFIPAEDVFDMVATMLSDTREEAMEWTRIAGLKDQAVEELENWGRAIRTTRLRTTVRVHRPTTAAVFKKTRASRGSKGSRGTRGSRGSKGSKGSKKSNGSKGSSYGSMDENLWAPTQIHRPSIVIGSRAVRTPPVRKGTEEEVLEEIRKGITKKDIETYHWLQQHEPFFSHWPIESVKAAGYLHKPTEIGWGITRYSG